ncbi:MAG: methyltransferase domain-containing protein [Chloroflexota bacterium]
MFAAADAYDRYVGRYSPLLARRLVAIAGVAPGQRAVDVGCGTGALTGQLVSVLGSGSVAAADPSEQFVAVCRARNPGVRVSVAPAEALPFGDAEFDHALSQLVVNFMADAHAGVAEMRRVSRPGGTITAATWDYAEGMTLIRAFFDAAMALDPAAGEHDEGRHMRYCQPGELHDLWLESGLLDVKVQPVVVSAGYADFDDLWQPLEHGVGPAGRYAVSLDVEHRQALRDELRRRLNVGDAPFELTARAWVARGQCP